jgi:hypothetical protein
MYYVPYRGVGIIFGSLTQEATNYDVADDNATYDTQFQPEPAQLHDNTAIAGQPDVQSM